MNILDILKDYCKQEIVISNADRKTAFTDMLYKIESYDMKPSFKLKIESRKTNTFEFFI